MKMSDQNTAPGIDTESVNTPATIEDFTSKTPEEITMINAKSERKRIVAALDAGTLCCQPDENGLADTSPAKNLVNTSLYKGMYQLLLKNFQKQNGFPTAEFGTFEQFDKAARFAGKEGTIKKGEHGITITLNVDGELKHIRLFNIAQAVHPEAVREYADHVYQQKQDYLKEKKGGDYREPKPRSEESPIVCSSVKPEEYLGQYFSALTLGRAFKVSFQQNDQFRENMKDAIFEKGTAGHINPYNLNVICNNASSYCKSFIPEYFRPKGQGVAAEKEPALPKPRRNRETESMGR
jgi:hypothetical protein